MKDSLKTSILKYLKLLNTTVNFSRVEKVQEYWWTKRAKTRLEIKILLLCSSTSLLIATFALLSIAAPQKITQVNPSNTISRPTLKVGSQGERVSELQAALKLLGFYSGAIDGIYNENTASAVSRFQQAAGLDSDGIVNASTWQRLFPNEPIVASPIPSPQPTFNSTTNFPVPTQVRNSNLTRITNPNPTNTPRPATNLTANPNPTNTPKKATTPTNSSSEPRPANPGQTTTSREQKTPNRTQSTTRTGSTTRPQPTPTTKQIPGVQYTSEGWPILRVGMRNAEVVKLQERLQTLGYLKGSPDGDFGATTEAAVKAVQNRYGLEADGVVGGGTWEILVQR